MTTERAIELLHRLQDEQFDGIHGDERREALSMAVRALEGDGDMISRKAVMKEFSDFVRKSNNSDFAPTPTWNDAVSLVGSIPSVHPQACDDAISRKMAIDAVNKLVEWYKEKWHESRPTSESVIDVLNDLPSAQTERKKGEWITVPGRLGNEVECNKCHSVFWYWMGNYRFCPNCGCRMEGESDE